MCTVSWMPTPAGYALFFNRDERRTRPAARPPTVHRRAGMDFLAPIDAEAGGTWIGVNRGGVTICLLNRYHESPADLAGPRTSRGLLVLDLLTVPGAERVAVELRRRPLDEFQPFTICAVDRARSVSVFDWTGTDLSPSTGPPSGLVRASSGRDQLEAERIRTEALGVLRGGRELTLDLLDRFHRSHYPERGPFSVCMHREEAETQSLTTVQVTGSSASMAYVAGSPCLGAPPITVELRPLGSAP